MSNHVSPKSGKKLRVNLLNIDSQPPIKEGVNTPKSCAICARFSVNAKELMPKTVEDFMGPKVTESAAVLRQRSYEKRRQALLAKLVPYRKKEGSAVSPNRSPSRGESPVRNVDDDIAAAQERHSTMIANEELTGLDKLLQKEVHELEVLRDRHHKMHQKRVEHYYQRRAREIAVANRRKAYEQNPNLSPHRKTTDRLSQEQMHQE